MASTNHKNKNTDHGLRNPRSGRRGQPQLDHRASQVVIKRNPCEQRSEAMEHKTTLRMSKTTIRLATWNVRSLYQPGKLANVTAEMKRLNLNILGISDVRWPGSGKVATEDGTMYYSNNDESQHLYGVGIIVNRDIESTIMSFTPFSERIIMLQMKTNKNKKFNLIQIYAPTADKSEDLMESFYEDLNTVLKSTKKEDITVIMGDFNAKVGKEKVEGCTGEFGLGIRNERGDRLIEFSQSEKFVITNTFFKLPKRRLYTWKSPADTTDHVVRNQIDYILVKERYRNSIISVKTYPGADVGSDHNPLVASMRVKMKKLIRKTQNTKIDAKRLKEPEIKQRMTEEVNKNLMRVRKQIFETNETDAKWNIMETTITETQRTILNPTTTNKKKPWMTDYILQLMENRRGYKNKDQIKYKEIHRQIHKEIKHAKEKWLTEQCNEIEEYQRKHDSFKEHKKIKEITHTYRKRNIGVLKDTDGRIIIDVKEKLRTWIKYIEELFEDDRAEETQINNQNNTYLPILQEELRHALKNTKNGKSTGPDQIPVETLKCLNEETIELILNLFNSVYTSGIIPKQWLLSTFCTLPKASNANQCNDYRTISLISHTLKVFLKIIHGRIYRKIEENIDSSQFGFRSGLGTREALFSLNVLIQRCLDINQDIHICYIDFEKAFDKVRHETLIKVLQSQNIDYQDIRIIQELYWNQQAQIEIEGQLSESVQIKRGVRQGCVLSPLLFNIYSEEIFKEALTTEKEGIIINGRVINNIRFADDTVILASTVEELQRLVNRTNTFCEKYGLKINIKKTKYMQITKKLNTHTNITLKGVQLEKVEHYKYLGTWITYNNEQTREIKTRIEIARTVFNKMRILLCSRDLPIQLRTRTLKCYVFSTLLYGLESWTLKQEHINKLQAFEMWCYRRMLRISWTEKRTNVEVLREMGKERELITSIKARKLQYLGHIMRGNKYELMRVIMQGKIKGKRSIGRRRLSWLRNLREWFRCSSIELFRAAVDKVKIARMLSNLR